MKGFIELTYDNGVKFTWAVTAIGSFGARLDTDGCFGYVSNDKAEVTNYVKETYDQIKKLIEESL